MIKFSKLSALLLSGALLVAGCATEADIHKVNERIDQLEIGSKERFESIDHQIELLRGVDSQLKTAVEVTIPGQISDINGQLDALRKADTALGSRIDKAISDLTTAINTGDQKVASDAATALKNAIGEVNTTISNITKDGGIIDTKVKAAADNLQNQINTILSKIGEVKDKDGKDATVAAALQSVYTECSGIRSFIKGEIGRLEGRLEKAESALETLTKTRIPTIEGDIEKLKAFQAANESEVQTFKGFIGASKTTLADIDAALSTLTQGVGGLRTDVDNLIAAVNGEGGILERLAKIDGENGAIAQLVDAINEITKDGGIIDQHIQTALAAYLTKEQVEDLIASAKAEIYGLKNQEAWLNSELKKYIDNEASLALANAKSYTDSEIQKLQEKVIDPLSTKVNEIDKQINGEGGLVEQINDAAEAITEITKEGGLIDKAKAQAIAQANTYTNFVVNNLVDQFNQIIDILVGYVDLLWNTLFNQIQSVVYVPDYDDKKITINLARIYTAPQEIGDGVEIPGEETFIEQPTDIVYKVSPEDLAETLATLINSEIKENGKSTSAIFDVKPVKTRDEVAEAPSFEIMKAVADNATGYVTLTVQPKNVASSQFAANRFSPYYKYEVTTAYDAIDYFYYGYGEPVCLVEIAEDENGNPIPDEEGYNTYVKDPDYEAVVPLYGYADFFRFPIWKAGEYLQWKDRQNFAVALEIRKDPIVHYDEDEEEVVDDFTDISSAYDVLHPAITVEAELLPDLYYMDDDGNVRKDDKGQPMIADGEHQELPYISDEVKTVLENSAPAILVDGEVMSFSEAAAKLGLVLPQPTMKSADYDYSSAARTNENGYFAEGKNGEYSTVAMGENELSKLKDAVGDIVTVTYTWSTVLGNVTGAGEVEITKAQAEVELKGEIRWTYSIDADIDHALFVAAKAAAAAGEGSNDPTTGADGTPAEGGDAETEAPYYARVKGNAVVLTVVKDELEKIGAKPEDFLVRDVFMPTMLDDQQQPRKGASISVDGKEVEELPFEYISSTYADAKYLLEIQKFEWDKEYKVVCYVTNESSEVKVTVTINTIDRPRDPIQIDLGDIIFVINKENYIKLVDTEGNVTELTEENNPKFGYDAASGLYYGQSEVCYDEIFEAFKAVTEDGKYILAEDDFADWEAFATAEIKNVQGEEPKSVSAAEPGDLTWLRFSNEEGYLHTQKSKKLTPKQLKNIVDVIQKDENHTNDNLQRNWCSYIGQEIQILWTLKYEVPGYNFLHQPNYTRNAVVPYANRKEVNGKDYAGKTVWFTQASPLYEESRHVLSKYDVSYMNIESIAFNIVDEDDVILTPEQADAANIDVHFEYTPVEDQDGLYLYYTDEAKKISYIDNDVVLPAIDQVDPDFMTYGDLWDDSKAEELGAHYAHTTFYYRTYEYFIPMRGYMTIYSGLKDEEGNPDENGATFDVETRFTVGKDYQGTDPRYDGNLLYDNYELARWTPFTPITGNVVYLDLDKHEPTTVDILGGISFNDIRPDKGDATLSFPVLKNGIYVYGDGKNGFAEGVYADEAYDIDTKVVYDLSKIDPGLAKNFSEGVRYVLDGEDATIEDLFEQGALEMTEDNDGKATYTISEGYKSRVREIPTLTYDYTSQIEFRDTIEIPVTVTLKTKWMKEHELQTTGYKIIMRGLNAQPAGE